MYACFSEMKGYFLLKKEIEFNYIITASIKCKRNMNIIMLLKLK